MGDSGSNPNPFPLQSQIARLTVLLLVTDEVASAPWQQALEAVDFECRLQSSDFVGQDNAGQILLGITTDIAAIIWLQAPQPPSEPQASDDDDLPVALLARLQVIECDLPVLLVGDRIEPAALATCFRAGLADYLPAAVAPERLPEALRQVLATRDWGLAELAAENARLRGQLRQQRALERASVRLQERAISADATHTLQETLDWLQETLRAECCWLAVPESGNGPWRIRHLAASRAGNRLWLGKFDPFVPHYQHRLKRGQPLKLARTQWSAAMQTLVPLQDIEAVVLVPLRYDSCCWGALSLLLRGRQHPEPWSATDSLLAQTAALHCAIALCQSKLLATAASRTDTLERELQKIQAESDTQQEFFAIMSHEIRGPLANILGFARMLRACHYGPLNDRQLSYANALYNCSEYLLSLLNNLLDLSKIEANREELHLEIIPIEGICRASLELVAGKAQEQGIELGLTIAPDLPACWADRMRLQQILVNLLSNAVKFTREGSVNLQVSSDEREIRFSVADTGVGIADADLPSLFQPFQQIRATRTLDDPGTGLGLTLSLKLAQLHGGDITVVSEPQQGSCFTFHLPLVTPASSYDDCPDP